MACNDKTEMAYWGCEHCPEMIVKTLKKKTTGMYQSSFVYSIITWIFLKSLSTRTVAYEPHCRHTLIPPLN